MILLNGHSLEQKRRIVPEKLSLTITERDSTASMVPDSLSGITVKSWFLDETNPGKGIVWRVKSNGNDFATETPTIELEHVIHILRDRILFGEITPEMMGGSGGKCTAKQAVQYILSKSSDWTLGSFGFDGVSNPYKFDGDSLYDALVKVTKSLKDAWWSYDLTAYPFKLNITKRSESVGTEMRCGRNLVSITRTQDTANMYTRFYPIGKDDLHISGNYVERNTGSYGVIEHVEVNSGLETEAELRRWANEKLDVHAQPLDTIEIEGLELADATGESLDRLRIGRVCRVPLPEYGTVIEEKITQIQYQDKLFAPEVVQVTLANAQEDIAQILADAIKEGAGPMGAGGRGGARQEKEDHAWFEDTDEYVAMVAEKTGVNELGEDETLTGLIRVEAGKITQIVSAVGSDGKVTAASICLAIENGGSAARISADHISLSGRTTINDVMSVSSGRVQIKRPLRVEGDTMVETLTVRGGGSSITLNDSDLATTIKRAELTNSGKTLKLTPYRGDPITFEKAVDLTGSWASGVFTAVAGDKSLVTSLAPAPGQATWDGNVVSIPIYATIGSSGVLHNTGKVATATKPADTITYGTLSESGSNPGGADKVYDLDTRYTYHYFYVTVNGVSHRIVCRT